MNKRKILFITWNSFGIQDMLNAYANLDYQVDTMPLGDTLPRGDVLFEEKLTAKLRQISPYYVFTFNYYPVISKVCQKEGVPYVSWIYDSPYVLLYSYTAANSCNHIYLFDQEEALFFRQNGIKTVQYLPMAANVRRLSSLQNYTHFEDSVWNPEGEVSFVGSLYLMKSLLYEKLNGISDTARGYLNGIIAAQRQVYGYNFIEEMLTARPDIMNELQQHCPLHPNPDGVESIQYLLSQYLINREITTLERSDLLKRIASSHQVDLYTDDLSFQADNVLNHGTVDYYEMAPYVYRKSLINLNISLRSIKSGIPLRCFEIMGSGGFLLSNYQSDFLQHFVPGEAFVYFDSKKDMMDKIEYYLKNEAERKEIAQNGYVKVAKEHTFECRIREMEENLIPACITEL